MSGRAFETAVQLRRKDFDASGHMYHGEYLTVIDEARRRFLMGHVIKARRTSYIAARIEIDFLKMILLKCEQVCVRIQVEPRLGNSSFELHESVHVGDTVHARTRTVAVIWDVENDRSRRIGEDERHELGKYFLIAE